MTIQELIRATIEEEKKELLKVRRNYRKYDNYEDMHMIDHMNYHLTGLKALLKRIESNYDE